MSAAFLVSTLLTLLGYSWTGPQTGKDPALPALLSRLSHSSIFLKDKPSFVASRQENFMGDYQKRLSLSTIASLGRNSCCVTSCLSYFLQCPLQFSPLCLKQTTESLFFLSFFKRGHNPTRYHSTPATQKKARHVAAI